MDATEIKHFIEAALLAAGRPLSVDQLQKLFDGRMAPEKSEIRQAIAELNDEYEPRGITISEVASGFRVQVKSAMADRLQPVNHIDRAQVEIEQGRQAYSIPVLDTLAAQFRDDPTLFAEAKGLAGRAHKDLFLRALRGNRTAAQGHLDRALELRVAPSRFTSRSAINRTPE